MDRSSSISEVEVEAESDSGNKLPLKRVELSLSKFNEVAIPHHLDLLRQHKANIIKYSVAGESGRVRVEQTAARRAAARLRALLGELDALRRAVRASDRAAFDALTARAIDDTRTAITDYTDVIESERRALLASQGSDTRPPREHGHESMPMLVSGGGGGEVGEVAGSVTSTESVGVVVQLQLEGEGEREREETLRGWSELQEEVSALHETWRAVHEAARAQRDHVERVGGRIEVAAAEVEGARGHLALGERLRGGAGVLGGAALGALAGGPVGLLVGLKAGAAAALAGSLLGYAAGRLLPAGPRRRPAIAPAPAPDESPTHKDKEA